MGLLGVQFPAFVKLGEGFTPFQGQGVQAVIGFVVVKAGRQVGQPPETQEGGQGQDGHQRQQAN